VAAPAGAFKGQRPKRTRLTPDARREQVLAAARQVFIESGLAGTTVKGIAEAAGVTETAIYHHFSSKDELFHQAVEAPLHRLVQEMQEQVQSLADHPDVSRRQLLAKANELILFSMVEIAPLLAVTLFSEGEQGRVFYIEQIFPQFNEAINVLIAAGWANARAEPELATLGFIGVHYGLVMDAILCDEELDVPWAAARITALFEGSLESDPRLRRPPPPADEPRQRERIAGPHRRRLIIEAARGAFVENGLTATTMKDIAGRAGMTDAGLYSHFQSKDDIYRAAVCEPLEQLVDEFYATVRRTPYPEVARPRALLRQANEQLVKLMVELMPLLAVALFSDLKEGRNLYHTSFLPNLEKSLELIVRQIYAGHVEPAESVSTIVESMLGLHLGVALDNFMRGRDVDVHQLTSRLTDMLDVPERAGS
jgi:AcrR family transcriptional regulator